MVVCRSLHLPNSEEVFLGDQRHRPSQPKLLLSQDSAAIRSLLVTAFVKVLEIKQQSTDETERDVGKEIIGGKKTIAWTVCNGFFKCLR